MTLDHDDDCAFYRGVEACTCGALTRAVAAGQSAGLSAFIHPKAHVEGSTIGSGTKVWQFASVTRGARIGRDCTVAPFALLDGPKVGDRCIISMHTAIGPGFEIGNDVFVGPSVTLCNDAWPRTDKTGFDAEALFDGRLVTVRVEDGASIGANAVLLPGVTIGRQALVAAGAVVDRSVPAGHLWTRSGGVVEINTAWAKRRMRAA